jgi:hypothetical protein
VNKQVSYDEKRLESLRGIQFKFCLVVNLKYDPVMGEQIV